ncbi:lysozyme c-1-like [Topomyia yanbarensis]|uniref:lysozyme c-1-like n=1 Tax=Topomyia yanbarensis TaxID=2498891 RepID=UPI00273B59C4|nr:lysozyme c-1-like [Topomyia yanbarensis]
MKQFTVLIAIVATLAVFQGTQAKTFSECELARLLRTKYGFDKTKVNNFVCLAKAESTLSTTATHKNSNGSTDYGLFQINNKYWCSTPGYKSAGNDCKIACSALLTDDISQAVSCANKVYARHGYSAWNGWKAKCQSGLKDLSSC